MYPEKSNVLPQVTDKLYHINAVRTHDGSRLLSIIKDLSISMLWLPIYLCQGYWVLLLFLQCFDQIYELFRLCNIFRFLFVDFCFTLIHILEGCYTGNSSKQTPPNMRTEDKRVAVCADFCADDNFTHFGLMASINNLHSYNIMYLF